MDPGGDVPQRIDDRNVTAQGRRRRAGVELESRLQEEGFRGKTQDETTIGECVCEAVPDLPERHDRVPYSRSRGVPEVIVVGVPKNGIPRAATFKVDVDAVKSEGRNKVKYRIDEGISLRIRIEFECPAGCAAN